MATATQTRGKKKAPAPDEPRGKKRLLLKHRAYTALKGLIQNSKFRAGEFLSERQLAHRLGMSKTPIKAAIERLAVEGFVAVSPQQGIVVRELSIQEAADQFEARAALEVFVVRAISGRLTAEQSSCLRRNLDEQTKAGGRHAVARYVELDTEFHRLLFEFYGNQELLRVMLQLREKMHRVISWIFSQDSGRLAESRTEHAAILAALVAGDAELAARRMEQHLEYGKQFLLTRRPSSTDVASPQ